MNLILETASGPATGKCFAIRHDEVATFGRTDAAKYVITDDDQLSRRHFAIRFDPEAEFWQLRDLESRHGTLLDGEKIEEAHFVEGSEITAGGTVFRTREAADEDATPEALAVAAAGLVMFTAVAASERKPAQPPKFSKHKTHTPFLSYAGEGTDPDPASIVWTLAQNSPLYLIADFVKAGMPFPKQIEKRDYLFNWADDEVLAAFSPIVLGPEDPVDPYEIIDELWGKDAVVCVFSDLDRAQQITQLRAAVRGDDGLSSETPQALAGCCWPEALRPMLLTAPDRMIGPLLKDDQVFFMEGEPPAAWHLFVSKERDAAIRRALDF